MRHVSRVTAYFKYVHQEWLSHISDHPLLVCKFVAIYKRPLTSLSGKNLGNNGHSSYKCGSLAQSLDTSAASISFLEGASASESDSAWILNRGFIILYLPKIKWTCVLQKYFWRTHVWHMCNYCRNLMRGWVDLRNSPKEVHFIHKVLIHIKMKSRLQRPLKTNNR